MADSMITTAGSWVSAFQIDFTLQCEIAIFLLTVVFTFSLRHHREREEQKRRLAQKSVANGVPQAQHRAQPKSDGISPVLKQMANVINRIVDLMESKPTLKDLSSMLQMYKSLNTSKRQKLIPEALVLAGKVSEQFYYTMIQIATRLGPIEELDIILDDMTQAGIKGSVDLYENAMKLLASHKKYKEALQVYDRFAAAGLELKPVTCSCLVVFASEIEDHDRALSFFEKLSSMSTPSVRAYMTILRVYGKRKDWSAALATWRDMRDREVPVDATLLNLVLAVGAAVDELSDTLQLLDEAEAMTPPLPDIVSYNTVLKLYAQRKDADGSLRIVHRVQQRGLRCTIITFNTALNAAYRASDPAVATALMSSMTANGLRADSFTCSILINLMSAKKMQTHDLIERCIAISNDTASSIEASERTRLRRCVAKCAVQMAAKK